MDNQNMPRVTEQADDEYEAPKVCISPLATRPILYTDTVGGKQTCRDDLWAVTTDELNALHQQAAPEAPADDLDALVREYGNAPVTGPGRTRRIVMREIYHAAGKIFAACENESATQQAGGAAEKVPCGECNGSGYTNGPCEDCNGKGYDWEPIGTPAATTASASREPEGWRDFIKACAEASGGMVNGNRLAMRARELLDSAPAPSRDADWQSGYKTGYETGLSDGRAEFTNPAATSPAERAALARAPLPAQGDAPMLWFDPEAVERSRLTDYADSIIISGTSVKFGHNTAPLYAAPAQAGDAQWSKEPPTEQADYWHWDGDEDHAPMIYHVLWSGTAKKCFVSIGQYGIDEAIWCDNFGGYWMKIEQPSVRAAMSASQGKTQEAK